jgi:hypothetical protein
MPHKLSLFLLHMLITLPNTNVSYLSILTSTPSIPILTLSFFHRYLLLTSPSISIFILHLFHPLSKSPSSSSWLLTLILSDTSYPSLPQYLLLPSLTRRYSVSRVCVTALTWAVTERPRGVLVTNANIAWTLLCVAAEIRITDVEHLPGALNEKRNRLSQMPCYTDIVADSSKNILFPYSEPVPGYRSNRLS